MKKVIIAAVALLCLVGTAAAQRHLEYKWRGFYATVDFSYGMNLNRAAGDNGIADTISGIGMGFSGGYQFSKEAGLGAGVLYFVDGTGAFSQMPVFVELRSHFMRSQLTPYTVLQAGYSLPVGASSEAPNVIKITKGGLYFGFSLGARYAIERTFAVGVHVDYKLMQSNEVTRNYANGPKLSDPAITHLLAGGVSLYF